jgi:hypothetical protein
VVVFHEYPDIGFSLTGGYNFRERNKPLEYFYKEREGLKYGNIFISFFTSEAALLVPSLMFTRDCLPVIQRSTASNPSSDVDFLLGLALHFKAIILYEPLLYRRLHEAGFSIMNWKRGYLEWIQVIHAYQNKKHLPVQIAKDALFRLYINYGEKSLLYKKRKKAMTNFYKAWTNKPFSIVPLKKMAKAVLK